MMVCPHNPKMTSTPRRSRYSVSRYEAIRVSLAFAVVSTVRVAAVLIRPSPMWSEGFAVVELAEQFLLRWPVLGNRPAHPRDVHVVLQRDVLVGDVAAPDAAAHARGHRHPVGERTGIRARLHLADHHPADRRDQREAMDVVVVVRVDPARVPLAGGLEDSPDLVERVVEAVALENREHGAELLGGEAVLRADVLFLDEQEGLVLGNREPGGFGDDRGGAGDGVRGAMAVCIPVGLLEQRFFAGGGEGAPLRLPLLQERGGCGSGGGRLAVSPGARPAPSWL